MLRRQNKEINNHEGYICASTFSPKRRKTRNSTTHHKLIFPQTYKVCLPSLQIPMVDLGNAAPLFFLFRGPILALPSRDHKACLNYCTPRSARLARSWLFVMSRIVFQVCQGRCRSPVLEETSCLWSGVVYGHGGEGGKVDGISGCWFGDIQYGRQAVVAFL